MEGLGGGWGAIRGYCAGLGGDLMRVRTLGAAAGLEEKRIEGEGPTFWPEKSQNSLTDRAWGEGMRGNTW